MYRAASQLEPDSPLVREVSVVRYANSYMAAGWVMREGVRVPDVSAISATRTIRNDTRIASPMVDDERLCGRRSRVSSPPSAERVHRSPLVRAGTTCAALNSAENDPPSW